MTMSRKLSRKLIGTAAAALIAAGVAGTASIPAAAQTASRPANDISLSVGTGRLVRLPGNMSDLFVANPAVADVQVRSANQIYVFGKGAGETTVYATNAAGKTLYSANVTVGANIGSIDEMLRLAMPQSEIQVTPMNGFVLLTGTVATPADVEDAGRLTTAYLGEGTQVISRLKTATPLQVMLQVKIAEVSRSLTKDVGVNLQGANGSGDFRFGTGRDIINDSGQLIIPTSTNTFGLFGNVLGLNLAGALDLRENNGLVTTLAEPNLVALSGETASFLAGGEIPIPVSNGINGTSIEFKQYGVSLAFTPTVLEGGRISMRVRPEVSELSAANGIRTDGFTIPGIITRRTETTVELGSGQSFAIGGLLSNNANNSVEKTPFLGSLPILGALFRSNGFRRNETELVIVVTPYLIRPVNASQIALPTDGYHSASDPERIFADRSHQSISGERRPGPVMANPQTLAPSIGAVGVQIMQPAPVPQRTQAPSAKPGFGF
ncbi:MAG: type II and III secretion system protein family protein [Sphingosinicella sp.]|nr:type II and III secretion system protein family protein [Sphingosinicella sp.]